MKLKNLIMCLMAMVLSTTAMYAQFTCAITGSANFSTTNNCGSTMSVNGNAQLRYYSSDPPGYFDYCPGSQVTVYVQYYNGSSWVNITSAVVNASTGTYNISFTPVTSANHRIYEIVTNDGTCSCSPTYTSGSTYINKYVPVTAGFKINTSNASTTSPYQGYGYNCPVQNLIWNNNSSGSTTYGFQWKLYYQECNSTGGGLTGSIYGQSTWSSSTIANSYDLKTAWGGFMGGASAIGKYYLITLEIKNSCSGTSSTKQGIVYINSAPSNPGGVLRFNGGTSGTSNQAASQNIASPNLGGCYSSSFNLTSATGSLLYYKADIDEVNCSTGAFVQSIQAPAGYTFISGSFYSGLGINALPEYSPAAYFGNNCGTVVNKCYKMTVTYGNICATTSEWTYFKIDGAYKTDETVTDINELQSATAGNTLIQLAPNPATNFININIDAQDSQQSSIKIYDLTGREVMAVAEDFTLVRGENLFQVNINSLSSGTYIAQIISADGYRSSLKFIKNN